MSNEFQGDVLLYDTDDGGEIQLTDDNLISDDTGFDTFIYLCLFGGNEDDNGTESTSKKEWWGNKLEDDPKYKLTSRIQNIIKGYPANPSNLNKVQGAAKQDLQICIDLKIVDILNITTTIPDKNKLNIEIEGIKDRRKIIDTKYEENWLSKLS